VKSIQPEEKIREVVDACTDCDVCRHLMDVDCLFFPELYRLWDREKETGKSITPQALRQLVDQCNFCALCPCPNIRADIIEAKTRFIERDGLKYGVRTIEDVERIGRTCGTFPGLFNKLLSHKSTSHLVKKMVGIHLERRFPEFPREYFSAWTARHLLNKKTDPGRSRKVAFFVGCTGRYLFPEVPKAAVAVLEKNDIEVYVPQQKCCGMPTLLEGDRNLTLKFAETNLNVLKEAVDDGYDIVCSCPTCGFMLKKLLIEGAYYSAEYQEAVGGDRNVLKLPSDGDRDSNPGNTGFVTLQTSIYGRILKDDGYFSGFSARDRVRVAENTFDLGEYLKLLHESRSLEPAPHRISGRVVYFAPCHGREQNIGSPYVDLLNLIPKIELEDIDGQLYCCGMAGIMGFKQAFHDSSIRLGQRLMDRIRDINPDRIVTECLSCRLQFNQLLPYPVAHPVEILKEAYAGTSLA
jgi:glycerol-3-phosphate dehydrogenase subunit C